MASSFKKKWMVVFRLCTEKYIFLSLTNVKCGNVNKFSTHNLLTLLIFYFYVLIPAISMQDNNDLLSHTRPRRLQDDLKSTCLFGPPTPQPSLWPYLPPTLQYGNRALFSDWTRMCPQLAICPCLITAAGCCPRAHD